MAKEYAARHRTFSPKGIKEISKEFLVRIHSKAP
jgi:hypothetical protein